MNPTEIKDWLKQPDRFAFNSMRKQATLRYIEQLERALNLDKQDLIRRGRMNGRHDGYNPIFVSIEELGEGKGEG